MEPYFMIGGLPPKRLVASALFLVIALGVATKAFGASPEENFDAGQRAFEQGNYTEAMKWFRLAAEQGIAEAQFNLGV